MRVLPIWKGKRWLVSGTWQSCQSESTQTRTMGQLSTDIFHLLTDFSTACRSFWRAEKEATQKVGSFFRVGCFWEVSGLVAENRVGGRCTRHSCRVVRVQERWLARCPGSAGPRGNKKSPRRSGWKELQSERCLSERLRKSGPKILAVPPLHACLHVGGTAQLDQTGHLAMTVAGSGLEKELWIQHLSVSGVQLGLLGECAGEISMWSQDYME